jgi:HAD superfamily hydrolase (TIGR01662 family)
MFKVVIIDVDDTLCLTEEATFRSENEVAASMGFAPMTRATHQKNWGMPLKDAIVDRIPGIDVDLFMEKAEQAIEEYVSKGYLDLISKENLKVLDILKDSGKKLAIVTSRSFAEAKHLLHESHPLNKTIEAFYHRDNLEYLKPDPRVFNKLLAKFNVLPKECVYVGDSISDAVAAKGAGMHFVAVLESGLRTKDDFADQNVDFFADKFTDIVNYILPIRS